jgi:hypothetical protein
MVHAENFKHDSVHCDKSVSYMNRIHIFNRKNIIVTLAYQMIILYIL